MKRDSKDILKRVNHLAPGDDSQALYDDWSADYDAHLLGDFGYISPAVAARALADWGAARDGPVLDYGCGTGLVGMALREQGFKQVDGVDISSGMLQQARAKQAYRELICGDLTAPLALADGVYDAAICVGSMGAGHVGARHVPELLRPLREAAIFVIIINAMHYAPEGFEQAFRQMQDEGLWTIHRLEQFNYMTEFERPGWLLLAEKSA